MARKDFAESLGKLKGGLAIGGTAPNSANHPNDTLSPSTNRAGVLGLTINPFQEELERAAEALPKTEIEITHLIDNPYQYLARSEIESTALEELANSIRQNGFYGTLLARPAKNQSGFYELAFGHRRREASKLAGLKTLPVKIINDLSDKQMAQIMASENFSRQDLTPTGEANVVGLLSTTQNLTIKKIAEIIGRGESWVGLRLALYEAPTDLKKMVEQKPETLTHMRLLTQLDSIQQREPLIKRILEENLTRDQLQNVLQELKASAGRTKGQGQLGQVVKKPTIPLPERPGENNHKGEGEIKDEDVYEGSIQSLPSGEGQTNPQEGSAAATTRNSGLGFSRSNTLEKTSSQKPSRDSNSPGHLRAEFNRENTISSKEKLSENAEQFQYREVFNQLEEAVISFVDVVSRFGSTLQLEDIARIEKIISKLESVKYA